ncbi:hypothetical protein Pse7429DRAFT_2426 [Pseudanabaena biceps PCC 7429]|uniref:Uncharacterized protein n=1 Tax=Pseudanabaena biceps PCC 7429 TaxID=927668 RepID=L8N0S5_9CYAN|nr:hypothetical protein Pse7429DRAFT_2426 [Pseudanabaena biceps PCC 7429]
MGNFQFQLSSRLIYRWSQMYYPTKSKIASLPADTDGYPYVLALVTLSQHFYNDFSNKL